MKVSYNWLKNYVSLDHSRAEIEDALTLIGFEVEGVVETGMPDLPTVVVGEVLASEPHPNADRLSVCSVNAGESEPRQIVCGAKNYKVGDKVPVALPGTVLPGEFKIKESKLRGVPSAGMMCSARELGLGEDAEGLMILDPGAKIGVRVNDLMGDGDTIFDVEVTPNRADCLCHVGIARELAAYLNADFQYPEVRHSFIAEPSAEANRILETVLIETEDNCPHYTAHRIAGVKVGPSPQWLREAIEAVGWRPVNNVVDITNYVLMELGQPLHAFDADKITGARLLVRQAGDGEKITLLDGKEHTLGSRTMVIADEKNPLVVAGVMGSVDAEVDESTVDIVLESAYFRAGSVRATSRRLGVTTESSYRFERGVDPTNLIYAAQRAVDLILDVAGGKLVGPMLEAGAEPVIREEIRLHPDFVRERAGFDIPDKRIAEILRSLELQIHEGEDDEGNPEWTVEIPSFRSDLGYPIDLVEEVIRIHGTDKIPEAQVVSVGVVERDDPVFQYNNRAAEYLSGQHFSECLNYTMRAGEELRKWFPQAAAASFALSNPLSSDQTHLRGSLLPGLLDVIRLNQARKTGAGRFFESGRVFQEAKGTTFEMNEVGFAIVRDPKERAWLKRDHPDFFSAKNHIRILAGLAGFAFDEAAVAPVDSSGSIWQEGHAAAIGEVSDPFIACMGFVDPFALREWDIEGEVVAGTLRFRPEVLEGEKPPVQFEPFASHPAAERDLALLVDSSTPAGAVYGRLKELTAEALKDHSFKAERIALFDLYEGKGLPENKKSLAFAFTFRAADRTLTDNEVNEVFNAIQKAIREKAGFGIRE